MNSNYSNSSLIETYNPNLTTWDCPTLDGLDSVCNTQEYQCNQCPPGWVGDPRTECRYIPPAPGDESAIHNGGTCPHSGNWPTSELPNTKRDWAQHCNVLWPGCGTWSDPAQCEFTRCPPGWEYKQGAVNGCQVTTWNNPRGNCWTHHPFEYRARDKYMAAKSCDVSWPTCGYYKNCAVPENCTDYDHEKCYCNKYAPNTITTPNKVQMGCAANSYAICLANVHGHSPGETSKYLTSCVKTANKLCGTNIPGAPLKNICNQRAQFLFPNENPATLCNPVYTSAPDGTGLSANVKTQLKGLFNDKAWEQVADTTSHVQEYVNELLSEKLGAGNGGEDGSLVTSVEGAADDVIDSIGGGLEGIEGIF